ncbi:hypothetical protein SAMN05444366_0970 [Flavobacterium saccharophilum]|jgi:hypothetical protein|uniref:Uncharacterized protein n=1 Tax=Flavobacterium saccharophilum TaxID=29534 RepID=A0A1M7B913_9FLAO|nr:hypothetical protein SAMN05444366_0970 [Flavobacterium saccharophilum]
MLSALYPGKKYFFSLYKYCFQSIEKLSNKVEKIVLQ